MSKSKGSQFSRPVDPDIDPEKPVVTPEDRAVVPPPRVFVWAKGHVRLSVHSEDHSGLSYGRILCEEIDGVLYPTINREGFHVVYVEYGPRSAAYKMIRPARVVSISVAVPYDVVSKPELETEH